MDTHTTTPLVSVVMPVFNAGEFVGRAIESIQNQTYRNFEFIVVDDRSSDNSWEVIKEKAKKYDNMKVYRNTQNLKSGKTVERAIAHAKGAFLARMDADDIALPSRLEKQVAHLLAHKKTVAVGGQCILIDRSGSMIGQKLFPTDFAQIYKYIFQFCPLQQPTMMIARDRLPENFDFYGHGMTPVEDVELLFKLFRHGKVENLSDFVLMYRIHGKNVSLVNFKKSFFLTLLSRMRGVVYHKYRPTPQGVIMSIGQTILVLAFPQRVTFFLYKMVKKIHPVKAPVANVGAALSLEALQDL